MILVGSDGCEDSFGEDVSAELFHFQIDDGRSVIFHPLDEMNSRLVAVH